MLPPASRASPTSPAASPAPPSTPSPSSSCTMSTAPSAARAACPSSASAACCRGRTPRSSSSPARGRSRWARGSSPTPAPPSASPRALRSGPGLSPAIPCRTWSVLSICPDSGGPMSRPIELSLKIAVLVVVALVLARAGVWARQRMRPDPAASLTGVRFNQPPGQSPDQDLATLLEAIRAKHKLPALAAAVIKDGRVAAQAAVGVRRASGTEAVTIDDKFHLGSDTKAMTATLIAVLVEEGTLRWGTTVGEVFGDSVKDMDPAWKPVTVEQLVRNRGGAPAGLEAGGLWGKLWERKGTPTDQRMQLVG